MRIAFVTTAEPTLAYANMARLLAWTIRNRGGALADASITVMFNDRVHADAADDLRRWDVQVETRDRLSESMKCMNKYNGLFARATRDADWVVLLDCDTAVVDSLDFLLDWMRMDQHDFAGVRVDSAEVWGWPPLIRQHTDIAAKQQTKSTSEIDDPPYFNGGVVILRGSALTEFRDLVIHYSQRLYQQMRAGRGSPGHWARVQWNRFVSKRSTTQPLIVKPFFHKGYADQVAIVLAMLQLRLRYDVLSHAFNWRDERFVADTESDTDIRILHYLSAYYPIDRNGLFDGDWVDSYAESPKPGRAALANLVRAYRTEWSRRESKDHEASLV